VGLQISPIVSNYIIAKAGRILRHDDIEENAYSFLITNLSGKSILECNDFLDSVAEQHNCAIRRLGTLSHAEKATNE
jgi:hypothetical protein